MIAFKVTFNGKRVCTAGGEDLGVLSTIVSACGKLGKKTVRARPKENTEIFYSVDGLTSRGHQKQNYHVRWKSVAPIKVGDVIQVEVVEAAKVNRPRTMFKQSEKPKQHQKDQKPAKKA